MSDFRVVIAHGDEVLAQEIFTSEGDAEAFIVQTLKDEDEILSALTVPLISISKEELYKGTWVLLSKKMVRI